MFRHLLPSLCIGLIVAGDIALFSTAGSNDRQPMLDSRDHCGVSFVRSDHHFGPVSPGDCLTRTFRWTNTGAEPVTLSDIRVSCGCLAHEETRTSVAPGQTGAITIELRTGGIHPPARIKKQVWVEFTSSGRRQTVPLTLMAELRPDVVADSGEVVFKTQDRQRSSAIGEVVLRRDLATETEFATLRPVRLAPYYRVEQVAHSARRMQCTLAVDLTKAPTYPRSLEFEYVRDGAVRTVHLPVRKIEQRDGVRIEPRCFLANVTAEAEPGRLEAQTERSMRVFGPASGTVEITDIRASHSDHPFDWRVENRKKGRFKVWVARMPAGKRLSSTELIVSYVDRIHQQHGSLTLNAYVLAKP